MNSDEKTVSYTGRQVKLHNGNEVAVGVSNDGLSVALQFTNNKTGEPKVTDLLISTEAAIAVRDLLHGLMSTSVHVAFTEESPNA